MELHESAVTTARALVAERFPEAQAAWLAGSVVSGTATPTSDLDITVLLAGPPAPFRESLEYDGWPVELFVHSRETVAWWIAKDLERRRPTLVRLISSGVVLLDVDGAGVALAEECGAVLAAGPGPLSDADRDSMRYGLTDLLDDLADSTEPVDDRSGGVRDLGGGGQAAAGGRRSMVGHREVAGPRAAGYDAAHGTSYALRLHAGLAQPSSETPCCSRSWPRRSSRPPVGGCGRATASRGERRGRPAGR